MNKDNWPKATIETQVDPTWIDFLTKYNDIFGRPFHAGYWLAGLAHEEAKGWLVWEHDDRYVNKFDHTEAFAAWDKDKPLPESYYRLDVTTAVRAWCEGVKRWGENWYTQGDGPRYDVVVQLALLGEIKYG